MTPIANPATEPAAADPDLEAQAHPGHGIPSQDTDPAAQFPLAPGEAKREADSALVGGGLVAGAVAGVAVGLTVAGPVGVLVGATAGAVAGALGGATAGAAMEPAATDKPPLVVEDAPVEPPATPDTLPTSFGTFKPVGHVMVGLPTLAQADALAQALRHAGWPRDQLLRFADGTAVVELQSLIDNAGALAGFGYELTLLQRYLKMAQQGMRFLLVKVDGAEEVASATELARAGGATLAVHYRMLTVDELI